MRERDFTRAGRCASPQESGRTHRMVWRPKRGAKIRTSRQLPPRNAADLGDLKGGISIKIREKTCGPAGEHGFANPRRAVQQEVVAPGGEDLQGLASRTQAPNICEVGALLGRRHLPWSRRLRQRSIPPQYRDRLGKVVKGHHFEALDQRGLRGRSGRNQQTSLSLPAGDIRHH